MYQSKRFIEKKTTPILKKYLTLFLKDRSYITCKALKRKVFLSELPEAIFERKNAGQRLKCFWVAIDIIKKCDRFTQRMIDGKRECEIHGLSADGKKVFVHIREKTQNKDKRLFLVSTFYK